MSETVEQSKEELNKEILAELSKHEKWSIGHYYSDDSICVNLEFDGKTFHRHDNGFGPIPRFIRLGWAIVSLERESGLIAHRVKWKALSKLIEMKTT